MDKKEERRFFGRFFDEFSREFEDLQRSVETIFSSIVRSGPEGWQVDGPYIYGFSMTVGRDGRPEIREFGNVRPHGREVLKTETREPYVDVVRDQKENKLRLVAEMPGISKEDLKVTVGEKSVTIGAESGERKYNAEVPISENINPDSAKAKFTNGVLELEFSLSNEKGRSIRVD